MQRHNSVNSIAFEHHGQTIEVIYFERQFWVRSRPVGLDMEHTIWPVPRFPNHETTAKAVNRLLDKMRLAVERKEYHIPRENPFTRDKAFLAYLQCLQGKDVQYIQWWELAGLIQASAKQLSIF